MSAQVRGTSRVITTQQEGRLAREVLAELEGPQNTLRVATGDEMGAVIPPDLGRIIQQVLGTMARGGTVTISSVPAELTTSAAAAILGTSRPTLMKMVADEAIPTHRVGSHTRFRTEDVIALRDARRQRERAAFDALRALEDEDD